MKKQIISFLFVCFFISGIAAQNTASEQQRIEELAERYQPGLSLIKGNLGLSLEYATLLYKSSQWQHLTRADSILNAVIAVQVADEESGNFGLWPWYPGGEIGDKNVPLFHAHHMLVNLWELQDKMSFTTRAAFDLSCRRLVKAAERRFDEEIWELGREYVAYSNVFTMYVQTLMVASERFNSDRLRRMSNIQWIRFYNHWLYYGIDEFLSTTYDDVIFRALLDICRFATDERTKREATEILDYVYLVQSAVTHPRLKLPVSGIGRDYRACQKSGDIRVDFLKKIPAEYILPEAVKQMNENRTYPFQATGKAGTLPFLFQTYQLEDVAMGSMTGWGNYFWQQIHCMASAGISETERATLFIPGTYTPTNGFTDQHELSTFCVYNRLPTMWHLTQWRGDLSDIRSTMCEFGIGISDNFNQVKQDKEKVVLRAYGYDFYLFPYELKEGRLISCDLTRKHRDTTSPQYHQRAADFTEYVFPDRPEWFGVYVKVVKAGEKVKKPVFNYVKEENNIHHFSTSEGHSIRICIMEQGNSVQIQEKDLNLVPRISISSSPQSTGFAPPLTFKDRYQSSFLIGGAIAGERIQHTDSALVVQQFNCITCDNAMKPIFLHPQEERWTFEKADWLANFARNNNLRMRGHTLVWHQATPDWFFREGDREASPALLKERMRNHIHRLVGRYKDDVFCWDVVNEGIDVKQENYYRHSSWFNILGEECIEYAFRYAREAAPKADLYYNDYNLCDAPKRDAAYTILKKLKERDVPVDGVGFQAHWKIGNPTREEIRAAFDKFISLGLKIQITELDVSIYDSDNEKQKPFTPEIEQQQAAYYKMCFELFEEYRDHIDCVSFWGIADNHTWLNNFPVKGRKNYPLIFDEKLKPKQAYYEVVFN